MKVGDTVPEFSAVDQHGDTTTLSTLLDDGPIVLFFYPKAFTPGCTAEACHFRDMVGEFAEIGARPVGISADEASRQAEFDAEHKLGYPVLSDPDKSIAKTFGVKRFGPVFNKRATFVIDTDRRVLAAISSETNMNKHADEALNVLQMR